jgi:probable HAF family extracellular repeat protein
MSFPHMRFPPLATVWSVVAVLVTLTSPGYAQTYRATNLGSFPGYDGVYATALNNSGQIVGYGLPIEIDFVPFLWQSGTLTELGLLGGIGGTGNAINNSAQIAGQIAPASGSLFAALWVNGTVTNLGTLGGMTSVANGINSTGQVVGTSDVTNSLSAAFIWSSGTMSRLYTSTTVSSGAVAINDSGNAVGYVGSQAALFSGGNTTVLPQLPGGDATTTTTATAINNAGQIVGYMSTPDSGATSTAVLWSNGTATALGSGEALGINNTGQMVGLIAVTNGADAALWTAAGTKALDLNQLIDPATPIAPLVLIRANAINDSGWIIAIGSSDGGLLAQSFLLQPETVSLQLTPTSLSFASQAVATTSAAQTVTVKNPGTAVVNLNPIQTTGDFSQTNTCGTSLAAGSQCSVAVKFAPTAPGTRTGALTVGSGGTIFTANLTGSATMSLPSVTLTAAPASVTVGQASTLTWTSTLATSCTASGGGSGDGWTGTKPPSGTASVTESAAASYTFTLVCSAAGQLVQTQAVVTVTAKASSGGGGALDALSLLAMLALIELRRRLGELSPGARRR